MYGSEHAFVILTPAVIYILHLRHVKPLYLVCICICLHFKRPTIKLYTIFIVSGNSIVCSKWRCAMFIYNYIQKENMWLRVYARPCSWSIYIPSIFVIKKEHCHYQPPEKTARQQH